MTQLNGPTRVDTAITERERLIAYILQARGVPMTAEEIAAEVDLSAASVKRTAQELVKSGRVARTGVGDQARYVLLHPLKPFPTDKVQA
jgi:predicted transcriptional regulator